MSYQTRSAICPDCGSNELVQYRNHLAADPANERADDLLECVACGGLVRVG